MDRSGTTQREAQEPPSTPAGKYSGSKTRRRTQPDKFNRFKWRDEVRADKTVTANIKVLVCGLAEHINRETGEARVSTITLAKECGFSEAWVRKIVPLLHNSGWAVIEIGSKGRGPDHCNVYKMNPEKRTPCTVLAGREKRVPKPYFSTLKPHPVFEEPLNHKEVLVSKKESKKRGAAAARSADADRDSVTATTSAEAEATPPTKEAPVASAAVAACPRPMGDKQTPCQASGLEMRIAPTDADNAGGGRTWRRCRPVPRLPEPLEQSLAKVKRFYPTDRIGNDTEAITALGDALASGTKLADLILATFSMDAASRNGEVCPMLADFLRDKIQSPSIAPNEASAQNWSRSMNATSTCASPARVASAGDRTGRCIARRSDERASEARP